jgi:hypothetical protein
MKQLSSKHAILDLAVEDFIGLWEVVAAMRDLFPGKNESELRGIAFSVVRQLLEDGLITFYRGREFGGEEVILQPEEAHHVLSKDSNWEWNAPTLPEHIRLIATDKGDEAYYSGKL